MTIVLGLSLGVVIPLIILNLPLLGEVRAVDLMGYALGLGVILATAAVALLTLRDDEFAASISEIRGDLGHLRKSLREERGGLAYVVGREELYRTMAGVVRSAKERIDLTYQAPKPPLSYRKSEAKGAYLAALREVIAEGRVPVRRVILLTHENKSWIRGLVEEYRDVSTISLAISVEQVKFPVISVQLIDRNRTILVNLISAGAGLSPRDIVLDSGELTSIFESYYEALYSACEKVVENGVVSQEVVGRYLG